MLNILRNETGQGMVEYGLILGFVALVAVLAVTAFGSSVVDLFKNATSGMPTS